MSIDEAIEQVTSEAERAERRARRDWRRTRWFSAGFVMVIVITGAAGVAHAAVNADSIGANLPLAAITLTFVGVLCAAVVTAVRTTIRTYRHTVRLCAENIVRARQHRANLVQLVLHA